MRSWWLSLPLMLWAALPVRAMDESPAQALPDPAGRYRLVDVMETASGIEFGKDGRFRWFYTVGGLDMYAEGEWKRMQDFIVLKADGADAELAKVFRLERVGRISEWLPHLPADHPVRAHPDGIAVRMLDVDGVGPSSFMAFAGRSDGTSLKWQGETLGESDRWFYADAAPGTVVDQLHVLIAARLSRDIDVTLKPGDAADIVVSPAALGEEERFLMMTLEIDKDGSLIPDAERLSERPARYVRD